MQTPIGVNEASEATAMLASVSNLQSPSKKQEGKKSSKQVNKKDKQGRQISQAQRKNKNSLNKH